MAVPSVAFSNLPVPVRTALEAVDDRKARDVVALDLRGLTDAADYFVVASGTSDAHVRGIADLVLQRLAQRGVEAHHVEGIVTGRWVLLDFIDFVVHLFHPDARAFYQLERLWGDAPELVYSPTPERKV